MSEPFWIEVATQRESPESSRHLVVITTSTGLERRMTTGQAMVYAAAVVHAAMTADYERAVLLQLLELDDMTVNDAGLVVNDMRVRRAARRDVIEGVTDPFVLTPGVSLEYKAFIRVAHGDKQVSQWSPDEAREHAMLVLNFAACAVNDTLYYMTLRRDVGTEQHTATNAIADLGKHFPFTAAYQAAPTEGDQS